MTAYYNEHEPYAAAWLLAEGYVMNLWLIDLSRAGVCLSWWLIGGGLVAVWLVWVSYVLTWGWGKLP